jgi:hypothetical protein
MNRVDPGTLVRVVKGDSTGFVIYVLPAKKLAGPCSAGRMGHPPLMASGRNELWKRMTISLANSG